MTGALLFVVGGGSCAHSLVGIQITSTLQVHGCNEPYIDELLLS